MDAIFIILLSLFAVYGMFAAVYRGTMHCRDGAKKCLVVKMESTAEDIEAKMRILMKKYPDCELVVVDDGLTEEVSSIARRLCNDYENIKTVKESEL